MKASSKGRILIVEDAPDIAALLNARLEAEGFEVRVEMEGNAGLSAARQVQPDLIILDRTLPGLDGIEICRRVRQTSDVPILMLTAHGETPARIEGLNSGASDYLPKPFDLEELVARVNAQLRHRRPTVRTRFEVADLSLDLDTREVMRGGTPITLTPKEFDLLSCLIQNPYKVVHRERIIEAVWGFDFEGEANILEVYVSHLRHKIELPGAPKLLHTVRGVGYVLKE
ncbi:response regulator transcription factor [bacterium]|nr:response regulator transcription factor [bacterium]